MARPRSPRHRRTSAAVCPAARAATAARAWPLASTRRTISPVGPGGGEVPLRAVFTVHGLGASVAPVATPAPQTSRPGIACTATLRTIAPVCARLAQCLYDGIGGPRDPALAVALFDRQREAPDEYRMTCYYAAETLMLDDPPRALAYARRGCDSPRHSPIGSHGDPSFKLDKTGRRGAFELTGRPP